MVERVGQRIVTPPVFAKDSESDPSDLVNRVERLKKYCLSTAERSCRNVAENIQDWRDNELWRHFEGIESWEHFVQTYFTQPIEWFDVMEGGAGVLDKDPSAIADVLAKFQKLNLALEEKAKTATPNNKPGRPQTIDPAKVKELREQGLTQKQVAEELGCTDRAIRKTERGTNHDNIIISSSPTEEQGTSQDYLLRRIKTQAPELIPDIGKGKKYPSARSAAIAAGIIKPKVSFQVSPDESGASIASKLYQKLTKDQLIELTAQLTNLILEDNDND